MADGMEMSNGGDMLILPSSAVEMSADIIDLAKALPKAQSALGKVFKNATNPHFKKQYADLSAVIEAVLPPLNDAGFSVVQHATGSSDGRINLTTMLMHESGQWMRSTLPMMPARKDPQAVGSCITYGRRYGLMALAGVAPEDDDGAGASIRVEQAPQPAAKAVPARKSKADSRDIYAELEASLRATESLTEQTAWWTGNKARIQTLHQDFEDMLNAEMRERAQGYRMVAAE